MAAGCGLLTITFVGGPGVRLAAAQPAVAGLDVSSHDPSIDWGTVASDGAQFAYVKATEGIGFVNPDFAAQYDGSYQAGLIRGSYHFALPNVASGAAQASYFVANGGGWSDDGRTLPGALDIEYNPYGAECYGLSQSAMVSWITSFVDAYQALTTRWPVIYTTSAWWARCTGDYSGFTSLDPLWIAGSAASGALPGGWGFYTFWQYASDGTFPGDQDTFNGASAQLLRIATGGLPRCCSRLGHPGVLRSLGMPWPIVQFRPAHRQDPRARSYAADRRRTGLGLADGRPAVGNSAGRSAASATVTAPSSVGSQSQRVRDMTAFPRPSAATSAQHARRRPFPSPSPVHRRATTWRRTWAPGQSPVTSSTPRPRRSVASRRRLI